MFFVFYCTSISSSTGPNTNLKIYVNKVLLYIVYNAHGSMHADSDFTRVLISLIPKKDNHIVGAKSWQIGITYLHTFLFFHFFTTIRVFFIQYRHTSWYIVCGFINPKFILGSIKFDNPLTILSYLVSRVSNLFCCRGCCCWLRGQVLS